MAQNDSSKVSQNVRKLVSVVASRPGLKFGELKRELQLDRSDSTLYRLIKDAIRFGLIEGAGVTSSTEYFPTEQVALDNIEHYLALPLDQRKPVGYNFDWLDEYVPNRSFLLNDTQLTRLEARCARGNAPFAQISPAEMDRFVAEFCYASSNLEGNLYDYASTVSLMQFKTPKPDADIKHTLMVLNHRSAIRYAIDEVRAAGKMDLTPYNVRAIHALLSHELLEHEHLGTLRGSTKADPHVVINDSSYRPSPSAAIIEQAFNEILKKAAAIDNPWEASFFLLTHLPYLQPFADCNKRTARMVCNLPLLNAGITPISWMSSTVYKAGYMNGTVAVYEMNDPTLLAKVFVENFMRSAETFDVIRRDRQPNKIGARYSEELKGYIRAIVQHGAAAVPVTVSPVDAADFAVFAQSELDSFRSHPMVALSYGLSPHAVNAWVRSQDAPDAEPTRAERQR